MICVDHPHLATSTIVRKPVSVYFLGDVAPRESREQNAENEVQIYMLSGPSEAIRKLAPSNRSQKQFEASSQSFGFITRRKISPHLR